jgi:hypothetical protein
LKFEKEKFQEEVDRDIFGGTPIKKENCEKVSI